jgi:hypothetical protein
MESSPPTSGQGHGPELSSMGATAEDLRRRVAAIAEELADTAADRVEIGRAHV